MRLKREPLRENVMSIYCILDGVLTAGEKGKLGGEFRPRRFILALKHQGPG